MPSRSKIATCGRGSTVSDQLQHGRASACMAATAKTCLVCELKAAYVMELDVDIQPSSQLGQEGDAVCHTLLHVCPIHIAQVARSQLLVTAAVKKVASYQAYQAVLELAMRQAWLRLLTSAQAYKHSCLAWLMSGGPRGMEIWFLSSSTLHIARRGQGPFSFWSTTGSCLPQ